MGPRSACQVSLGSIYCGISQMLLPGSLFVKDEYPTELSYWKLESMLQWASELKLCPEY